MTLRSLLIFPIALAFLGCTESSVEVTMTPEQTELAQVIRDACGQMSEMEENPSKILRKSVLPASMITSLFPVWPKTGWGYGACDLMGVKDLVAWDKSEKTSDDGFFVIGSCPNGDDVAFKISETGPWPVYYLGHEHVHPEGPLDTWAVKVADSLKELLIKGNEDEDFPMDHYDATEANKSE